LIEREKSVFGFFMPTDVCPPSQTAWIRKYETILENTKDPVPGLFETI